MSFLVATGFLALSTIFIHEHLHRFACLLLAQRDGILTKRWGFPTAFLPDTEIPITAFRIVAATPLLLPVLLALVALTTRSFGCPRWAFAAVFATLLLSFCGSGLDIYTLAKLRPFRGDWTVLDQGDYLVLRRPPRH